MTEIEKACFIDTRVHWISAISYQGTEFSISLHPYDDASILVNVVFKGVTQIKIDTSYADDDSSLPWDIIGFDCQSLSSDSWAFLLHTDLIEFSFQAKWPHIDKPTV